MASNDSGLFLDSQFDLSVNSLGDIASTEERAELEKDCATYVAQIIDRSLLGNRLTDNQLARLEDGLIQRLERDPRIEEVTEINIRRNLSEDDANVDISLDSTFGPIDIMR